MKRILLAIMVVVGVHVQAQDDSSWIPKHIYKTPDSLMTDSDYIKMPNWGLKVMIMIEDSALIVNQDTIGARTNTTLNLMDRLLESTSNLDLWIAFNFPNLYDGVRHFGINVVHWSVEFTPNGYAHMKWWVRREPIPDRLSE